MARLTAKTRSKIPTSKFAGPGRSFPVENKVHAEKALQLAPRSEKAGNISPMQEAMIQQKARKVLGVKSPQKGKVARGRV
jgi:hypothetical protein